ncbi:MAG: biotin-dependent carboxyltransferase family protein, partial [Saccharothrix sp.]|nr:biotin-dependent carboxyltransferase family protein [Saccharothrix sp.]
MAELLTVHRAGHAVLTDLGRPGLARQGIPGNGAADQYSARVANVLLGNAPGAACVEITASDLAFSFSRPALVAVTGAPSEVLVGGRPDRMWLPVCVPADEVVEIRGTRHGMRVYVGVHGRLHRPGPFGSHAPDPLLGFDSRLTAGTRVRWATDYRPADHPVFRHPVFRLSVPVPRFGEPWTVDVTDGPDLDQFPDAGRTLFGVDYLVGTRGDHVGLWLEGRAPTRAGTAEILSRGVPAGAIEAPPAGNLIVLRRGRPVTAGYPVAAVATKVAQDALGQVRPGQVVRFRRRTVAAAVAAHRDQR